jgi:hypothetical protein
MSDAPRELRGATKHQLRCFCSRKPLLATYGKKADGGLYVHVKTYKGSRIYGEILISGNADIRIHCRECLRWMKINIKDGTPTLAEDVEPTELRD